MCMGGGATTPDVPAVPPPPDPAPQIPNAMVQSAGTAARSRAQASMGAMATIMNAGGAPGLATPPPTTAKGLIG